MASDWCRQHADVEAAPARPDELWSRLEPVRAALAERDPSGRLPRLLPELQAYLVSRFGVEDRALRQGDFTGGEAHRLAHHVFLEELARILAAMGRFGPCEPLLDRIDTFVNCWLVDHLEVADRRLAGYLARRMSVSQVA
jgi:hemerythrin